MNENQVALRCYVNNPIKPEKYEKRTNNSNSLILVFDTETTTDEYQNLLFGSCGIWENNNVKFYLFYNEALVTSKDLDILTVYAQKHGYTLTNRPEFVEKIFYPYVYNATAVCIGFNLPFDLSRLAIHFGESRDKSRKPDNGISLKLSSKPWYPGIAIKSIDSKKAFIKFTTPLRKESEKKKKTKAYRGCFLDLRTLLFALTNRSYTLKGALEDFQCNRSKIEVETHGKISEEYIDYNVNDTLATYELYEKALERYGLFCLNKEPNKLYSPASIGKAILDKIGIKPFDEKNPDFPQAIKGYLMTAYYGGRVEVRIRKKPVKVTYLDFTSMYPSLYVLLGLDKILKAEKVTYTTTTEKTQELLNNVKLEDLRDKTKWQEFKCLCRLKPNNDILPVRSLYGNKNVYNIGVNYLKSDVSLWYALPDLIASKLLTGKTPIIEESITIRAKGIQAELMEIEILKGIQLKPEEDIFKKLIEERIKLKHLMKGANIEDEKQLKLKQNILKIIANSASYGIYIEINTSEERQKDLDVYGLDHINSSAVKTEIQGIAFNPIIATMITSGAKLILAMAESLVLDNDGYLAYCDTDSIFVSPEHEQKVKDFFKPLNPYGLDLEMFKVEEDENGKPLRDVWFYGISAKRYCLYDFDKEPIIRKFSSHGLGENLMGLDQEEFWKDILATHYHPEQKDIIVSKYDNRFAVYNFRISSYNVYKRFKTFNGKKPLSKQIKPFNFITIGQGYQKNLATNDLIIPMLPFINEKNRQFEEIPYMPFTDYKTGDCYPNDHSLDTQFYWKPLSELLEDYLDHPESKSKGDIGILTRKQITINKSSIRYIGKESNELEESQIIGVNKDNYTKYIDIIQLIINLTNDEAMLKGISKRNLYYLKEKITCKKKIKINSSTLNKLEV